MASNRGPGAIQPEYQRDAAPPQSYVPGGGHSAHAGSVGGSWGSAPAPAVVHHHPGQSYSTPSITINSVPGASSGAGGTAVSDGTFERNLILELCPPGGMKPAPPPDKLANFARTCASLNSDLVCPVLLDCLEEGQPWIIRAKALCTMEAAIANGIKPDGTNPYRDFFFACRDEISPLGAHARSAIHEPARRVLALLGVSADSIPAAAAVAAAPAPNLLDFDDEPPTAAPQPPPSAPPPPPPEAGGSAANTMFGGMQVKSSVTPSNPNAPQAVVPPPAPSVPSSNLLDFDSMVAGAPAPAASSTDVFATSTAPPAAAPPATVSSMFDQLNVNDAADKKESDVKAVVSNGSSAFGFMNAADSSNGTASAAPTQQSFDPLKNHTHNLTPNSTQKKMMEMSPEQIQAMAYQQMMMQQQQLQMQMMLQQQQMAGGAGVPMVPAMGGLPMYPPLAGGGMPRRTPSLGSPNAAMPNMMPASFSFAPKPAQKDDKKFDFVKDAMAGHKK
jgi:hypothetical protein